MIKRAGIEAEHLGTHEDTVSEYFRLRQDWGTTHNLMGPRARSEPWAVDLLDACALVTRLVKGMALYDVGTGSGTPGLLVACLVPEHPVVLVEPIAKRTAFLRHAIAGLGLKNVRVVRGRWPCDVSHETYQVVSRAVVSPERWPLLAVEARPKPQIVYRFLAQRRPEWVNDDYIMDDVLEYSLPDHSNRLLERWTQVPV